MYCPSCSSNCEPHDRICPQCGNTLDPAKDPLVGTVLPGGYVLQECIGGGGMGQVYRAEQSALGRSVAVKIVHPYLLSDESIAKRFINEARLASRLNHPNSVAVIDFGRTERGLLYLVMEYLRGRDLARVLVEDGMPKLERVIDILRQLLDVLSEAHGLDIVHLDLKPDNIILEPTRRGGDFVKVVDFGLARMLEGSTHVSGPNKTIAGTPDYMSPEQCRGEPPDSRSDLYAVGVVLFLLTTGRLPFEGKTPTQTLLNHVSAPIPDPRSASGQGMPDPLVDVICRALAKDPNDRFQTAAEFSEALGQVRLAITAPVRMLSIPPDAETKPCPTCGEPVPTVQKFCGACGVRMPWASRLVSLRPAATKTPPPSLPFPFVGRVEEMDWLLELLEESARGLQICRVEGETGVGRTRLLAELDMTAIELEHPVFWMRPEPWPIGPPWSAVRSLIPALVGMAPDQLLNDVPGADELAHRGLRLLYHDEDATCSLPRACAASALKWALDVARSAAQRPVVLLVDDLEAIDGSSRNALSDALQVADMPGLMVVLAHDPTYVRPWMEDLPLCTLQPFDLDTALGLLGGGSGLELLIQRAGSVLPMYLEQLVRFDVEGGTNPPPRLGDLLAARLARLRAGRRRVLQAVAVLGPNAPFDLVQALVPDLDMDDAVRELESIGFLNRAQSALRMSHPLVRSIARAATPAAVLRELHAQVLHLAGTDVPVEVRAHHLQQAGDAFGALLSLESVGERARVRDDFETAVEAFRLGFELARRSAGDADLDDPMQAVALFGRKLGEALAAIGRHGEAEGILRESVDFASGARQRARVTFALAKVMRLRGRTSTAMDLARSAIDLAFDQDQELAESFESEARKWQS